MDSQLKKKKLDKSQLKTIEGSVINQLALNDVVIPESFKYLSSNTFSFRVHSYLISMTPYIAMSNTASMERRRMTVQKKYIDGIIVIR